MSSIDIDREFVIEAVPLTREAFAPFGDVVENPRPDLHPSRADPASSALPFNAVVANQGSAIKYQHVSRQVNLYDQAPSGRPGSAIMSIFVCAARARIPDPPPAPAVGPVRGVGPVRNTVPELRLPSAFPVAVLERHPYTTQTFIPLTSDPAAHYLVIVAPSLPAAPAAAPSGEPLPVPAGLPPATGYPRTLPGSGMPDLRRLRAFVANGTQAVTYGAGTWHAPMVALGEPGTALDFVVVQFANGVGIEDCQEVFLNGAGAGAGAGAGTDAEAEAEAGRKGKISVALRPLSGSEGRTGARAKL
ncbi:ureidoglycolate hydrolase [Thermothelomyces heterothallicus CBS 203.75]